MLVINDYAIINAMQEKAAAELAVGLDVHTDDVVVDTRRRRSVHGKEQT